MGTYKDPGLGWKFLLLEDPDRKTKDNDGGQDEGKKEQSKTNTTDDTLYKNALYAEQESGMQTQDAKYGDEKVVLEAVKCEGRALEYASEGMQNNRIPF